MKKFYALAVLAIFFMGCGPIPKGEQVQKEKDIESSPVIFRSMTDDYMGFYEVYPDSLSILVQDNDQDYHYYVYDSVGLIAEGDDSGVVCYDCDKQWNKIAIIMFSCDSIMPKVQFIFSRSEQGIDLFDCSVADNIGHEYWACSNDCADVIDRATSHITFPILEGYLDYLEE